jgi:ion channel-forming bestrophin family protein
MFVDYHRSVLTLLIWQWRAVVLYAAIATSVVVLDRFTGQPWFEIPSVPLSVLGAAIGIFVSFRTNSCYDRWWEGRRFWGQLVNTSRHFASQVLEYVETTRPETRAAQEQIVHRHIAYVHALRATLRGEDPMVDADVGRHLDAAELAGLADEPNPNHAILHRQTRAIAKLARAGAIDGWRLQLLDRSIATLLDVQGGCERIKKTPFPQSYGFVATQLIAVFSALLPLGIVASAGWFAIPVTVIVCLGFRLIDEVGDALEDPFTMAPLSLPLNAIATTIDIDLCKRLGERELPETPTADAEGVLM